MTDLQEITKKNNFLKFLNISLSEVILGGFFYEIHNFIKLFFALGIAVKSPEWPTGMRTCNEKPGLTGTVRNALHKK